MLPRPCLGLQETNTCSCRGCNPPLTQACTHTHTHRQTNTHTHTTSPKVTIQDESFPYAVQSCVWLLRGMQVLKHHRCIFILFLSLSVPFGGPDTRCSRQPSILYCSTLQPRAQWQGGYGKQNSFVPLGCSGQA